MLISCILNIYFKLLSHSALRFCTLLLIGFRMCCRSTLYTQVTQYATADDVTERAHQGCFVSGLYLEGAAWEHQKSCLVRQKPKQLVQELPILKIIPIESYKLKLQVREFAYCIQSTFSTSLSPHIGRT